MIVSEVEERLCRDSGRDLDRVPVGFDGGPEEWFGPRRSDSPAAEAVGRSAGRLVAGLTAANYDSKLPALAAMIDQLIVMGQPDWAAWVRAQWSEQVQVLRWQ